MASIIRLVRCGTRSTLRNSCSRIGFTAEKLNNGVGLLIRCMASGNYENIIADRVGEKKNVGLIKLNRPRALNALCDKLMNELNAALKEFEDDESIGCVVLTGSEKAFAAGGDVGELMVMDYTDVCRVDLTTSWRLITKTKIPIIAAVEGIALGGGTELAMMCDIIYAGDNASFGLPEILLGTIPGGGGTQRLPKDVGKSKAMELVLTGSRMTAEEARESGLVSKVFPKEKVLDEAISLAEKISRNSRLINSMAKEAVNKSYEHGLTEGLHFEKRVFHATFATHDRKEGMEAFINKRKPNFQNK